MTYMVFDVESVGLHGEGFSVGWVVVDGDGRELDFGLAVTSPKAARGSDDDRAWVKENVPPLEPASEVPSEVRGIFWRAWTNWKKRGAVLVADCAWPVEARFLAACVDDAPEERTWQGPYPLHDLASVLLATKADPLAHYDRLPEEMPAHNPLNDARQSARLLIAALRKAV